jgi:hypothetical protein
MGLRGLHARPVANHPQPLDDQPISPDALRVFRRMRKLELLNCCECPDDTGDPDTMCRNCETLWALNTKLCDFFHLPHWMYATKFPVSKCAGTIKRRSIDIFCWKRLRRGRRRRSLNSSGRNDVRPFAELAMQQPRLREIEARAFQYLREFGDRQPRCRSWLFLQWPGWCEHSRAIGLAAAP